MENRGGASATIGSDLVARGPADGYTVMVHSATHVANPHQQFGKLLKVDYDKYEKVIKLSGAKLE